MPDNNRNSHHLTLFHSFALLEEGMSLAGYSALISKYELKIPLPDQLSAIGTKHRNTIKDNWKIFTPRHQPEETLRAHLIFALKHEGIELTTLKALFLQVSQEEITHIVQNEPTGAYSRKIWFLYEWLLQEKLDISDVVQGNFVPLVNEKQQYPGPIRNSRRHRVRNNLPGTPSYCPIIRRTDKLERYIQLDLPKVATKQIGNTHADLLNKAAAFLLLKDSKASYIIEGESPPHTRIERWGKIIGEAGQRKLTIEELERLQQIVIADNRFIMHGCRGEGGFIGDHDRTTGLPLPVHISARAEDLESLLSGLIETYELLKISDYPPVLLATLIAFGFVFIHPFEDGNGRIHRYLLHHVLAEKGFAPKGLVFPMSAVMLDRISDYRKSLEHFSTPRLEHIKWRPTANNNIEVLNETIDLYRYFDATKQAEFFFECVEETVNTTLPNEVDYLKKHHQLNEFIKNYLDMPDRLIDLLIRFLNQNDGILSKRAQEKEFVALTKDEIQTLESKYQEIFESS